jgi:soluble lytic murein transglycosylase-like protein
MSYSKEKSLLPLVNEASAKYIVPVALILAHMKQESNFDAYAIRYEPAINDASIGLMQVLVNTAKTIDSTATLSKLYDKRYNIGIGTQYIRKQLDRYSDIKDAIAAYNAGTAYEDENGKYVSSSGNDVQVYVDRVYSNYVMYDNWLNTGQEPFLDDEGVIAIAASIAIAIIILKSR